MNKEIKGITLFSFLWETFVFGFIAANEFGVTNLVSAYKWFFYFTSVLAAGLIVTDFKGVNFRYTKAKYHFEIFTNTLLGLMLAYYGYFVCATILTFAGYALAGRAYKQKGDKNEAE